VPAGTVLDGEVVLWSDGRQDFDTTPATSMHFAGKAHSVAVGQTHRPPGERTPPSPSFPARLRVAQPQAAVYGVCGRDFSQS